MNNLMLNNEVTMTSVEVVELINKFRLEEGNITTKEHKTLMRDIRNEVKALELVGIVNEHNFVPVTYIDLKGENRPCFKLNKAGIMQMLNKESALVRYKTQQYIEALENRVTQLSQRDMLLLKLFSDDKTEVANAHKQLVELEIKEATAILEPKANKFDNFIETDGTFGFRDLVKHINSVIEYPVKETEVRELLRDNGIIVRQGNKYVISQYGVREGYGVMRDNIINGVNKPISRYTDKCRDFLIDLLSY